MSGTLNLGRVGLGGVTLRGPSSIDETTDTLRLRGTFSAATAAQTIVQCGQLRGYPSPDEPVVWVDVSAAPELDGWYRVESTSVRREASFPTGGEFEVSLRRMRGRAAGAIECDYNGVLVINTLGVADGEQRYQWAVPETAFDRNGPNAGDWVTRSTETGTLAFWHDQVAAFRQALYWASDGTDHYDGACMVEQYAAGGSTFYTLVGHDIDHVPSGWRINNGCVRVIASTTASKSLAFQWWDGAAWTTAKHYAITGDTFGTLEDPTSVAVIRNSPEEVRIALTWDSPSVSSSGRISTHLAIRRGDRNVRIVHRSDVANQWRLTSGETSTTIDNGNLTVLTAGQQCGLFTTSNDADGNRAFIATHLTSTNNTGTGSVIISSTTLAVWAAGIEIDGTSATLENEWESEILSTFGPTSERHTVRGR